MGNLKSAAIININFRLLKQLDLLQKELRKMMMEFVSEVCNLRDVDVVIPEDRMSCKKMLRFIVIEIEGRSFADSCCMQAKTSWDIKLRDEEACNETSRGVGNGQAYLMVPAGSIHFTSSPVRDV